MSKPFKTAPRRRIRRRSEHPTDAKAFHPQVKMVKPEKLRIYQRNARRHPAEQIAQLKSSMQRFGFVTPILVDEKDEVVAGHGRLAAARELGLETVPVISIEHLNEKEIRAYRLADNKIAENSSWNEDLLRIELGELLELETPDDLSFDTHALGFETAEIDLLLDCAEPDQTEQLVDPTPGPAISEAGDLWLLGRHRVFCGDALDAASYRAVLDDANAQLVLTDPPYNVRVAGHVRTSAQVAHREFAMASGEMDTDSFVAFLTTSLGHCAEASVPGTVFMCFMDWRHLGELSSAADAIDLDQINLCVWAKNNAGMGSLYRSQHELCAIYKKRGDRHTNNVQLGKFGRNRTNVWTYAGVNSFGRNRNADLADHPTVKPVAMLEGAIKDVTDRKDVVLDPFGGSGSTLLAAERSGRVACLIELDPAYVDVTIRRWQEQTGEEAIHIQTGEAWSDRAAQIAKSTLGGPDSV